MLGTKYVGTYMVNDLSLETFWEEGNFSTQKVEVAEVDVEVRGCYCFAETQKKVSVIDCGEAVTTEL